MKAGDVLAKEKKDQRNDLYKSIGNRISKAMEDQGCSIQTLISRCAALGYETNQSPISKIRQGISSMAITNLVFICKALSLDMNEILALPEEVTEAKIDKSKTFSKKKSQDSSVFISDPKDNRLKPYLGNFWGYYYSAADSKGIIEEVRIFIGESDGRDDETTVKMTYITPLMDVDGNPIQRIYKGTLVLSEKALTVYCNLRCEATGKQFNFSFLHSKDVYGEKGFKSAVCAVMCTNRGEVYYPTIQRMILSRRQLSPDELNSVRSQLKLNDKKILISKVHLRDVLKNEKCRTLMMERICDGDPEWINRLNYIGYCEFDESFFRGKFANETDEAIVINAFREYSLALPYNKVGAKASGYLSIGLTEPELTNS